MGELTELARSSGIAVAERIIQRQQRVHPKYLMGRGKLSELVLQALQSGVDLLIFDQDLNPSQMRSITRFYRASNYRPNPAYPGHFCPTGQKAGKARFRWRWHS